MSYRRRDAYDYSYRYYDPDPLRRLVEPSLFRQTVELDRIRRTAFRSNLLINKLEDRRQFDPSGPYRRPAALARNAADVIVGEPDPARSSLLPSRVTFRDPKLVSLCAKRHTRREVLHALGKTGGGARRRPRRTEFSDIGC